ncbi:MAG: N-acetylmuramoyl-L-alanine amidase [Oscillospiraceae bacterium]|nr:N-acetylmuramoyl-L-alanine amidase [Oscillospiraceae bacterium]
MNKKTLKPIVALFLALVMSIATLTMKVSAADTDDDNTAEILETLVREQLTYENPQDIIITQPDMIYRTTSRERMSIMGACDFNYPLYINGREVKTTQRGFFAVYANLKIGENEFVLTNNEKEETIVITRTEAQTTPQRPVIVRYDKPMYGVVNRICVTQEAKPVDGVILLTPLNTGTTVRLLGEYNDYYVLAGGTYVYQAAIDAFEGEIPKNEIKDIQVGFRDGFSELEIEMNVNAFYSLDYDEKENKATLTIDAQEQSGTITMSSGTIINKITRSTRNGKIRYNIELKEPPTGHYAEFIDGKMFVGFKHRVKGLSNAKVVIDAGHGGTDPGALGALRDKGAMEKDFNLYVSHKAREYLEGRGVSVLMLRSDDSVVALGDRTIAIMDFKPDISVSVHTNSMPVTSDYRVSRGLRVYYTFDTSKKAAQTINDRVTRFLRWKQFEPIRDNFAVTRLTACPALLFEMSFMSSPQDYEWLLNTDNLDRMGEALGRAIERYLLEG